jgi:hypothetical protein
VLGKKKFLYYFPSGVWLQKLVIIIISLKQFFWGAAAAFSKTISVGLFQASKQNNITRNILGCTSASKNP